MYSEIISLSRFNISVFYYRVPTSGVILCQIIVKVRKHPVIPIRDRGSYSPYDSPTAKWAARVGLFLIRDN